MYAYTYYNIILEWLKKVKLYCHTCYIDIYVLNKLIILQQMHEPFLLFSFIGRRNDGN